MLIRLLLPTTPFFAGHSASSLAKSYMTILFWMWTTTGWQWTLHSSNNYSSLPETVAHLRSFVFGRTAYKFIYWLTYKNLTKPKHVYVATYATHKLQWTSFSRSSASRVLNFFCTSLMIRNAVLRLDDGAEISPGSLELELRNVLR